MCCVVNVSPPLFQFPHPLYRPSVFPRPPDAANTGSAHFKSLRSPALISTPQNTRLASSREPCGALSSHPRLSCDKGLVATSPPVWQPCSRCLRRAPPSHQDTPELDASSSVWNRPSKLLHASFVIMISGRHGHLVDREPGPASFLIGTASLYELRSRICPTSYAQILRACVPWVRQTQSLLCADKRLLNLPTRPKAFATVPDPSDNPTVRISALSRRLPTRPLTCLGLSLINHLGRSKAEQGAQWYHSSRI